MMDEEKQQTTPVREAASLSDVERREAQKKLAVTQPMRLP